MSATLMVLVQHIMEDARRRLAILSRETSVSDAAEILSNPSTPLAVVCDSQGVAVGVVAGSDLVKVLARARASAHQMNVGDIMTSPIHSCRVDNALQQVWETMSGRSLQSMPILDESGRPQGVVYARDLARAIFKEVTEEEALLRDYVMGVGYQ
jgi:CBS domain-containing protein